MSTTGIIITGLICFLLGVASLIAVVFCIANIKRKNRKQRKQNTKSTTGQKKSLLSRFGTMNLILVIIGIALFAFTIVMISLFKTYGTIPDTLVTCVFGVLGTECGAMAWIKTSKERNKDRKWELEDRKYCEEQNRSETEQEDRYGS